MTLQELKDLALKMGDIKIYEEINTTTNNKVVNDLTPKRENKIHGFNNK